MPGLAAASPAPAESQEKKPLKPCCACPETKKARDAWSVRCRGGAAGGPRLRLREPLPLLGLMVLPPCFAAPLRVVGLGRLSRQLVTESAQPGETEEDIIEKGEEHCGHLIEAHKECMRALGFKI
ncbi:Cytochrome c oxidase copper chaperone [Galemys pyrenaicus]|uniref:Cytochrome c oxidase copper chaperone n=1 Tax=Galemys pyrenaicus TaxID=202257 RepID=A0A8J6DXR5_GALPY|nr:Cytochrome c oxidase copper chaperone [Galemys pyrenaicus]